MATLAPYDAGRGEIAISHLYPRLEPEVSNFFGLGRQGLGDYESIFRHATSSRIKILLEKMVEIRTCEADMRKKGIRLKGVPYDLYDLYRVIYGEPPATVDPSARVGRWFLNLVISAAVVAKGIAIVARSFGRRPSGAKPIPLGADLADQIVREFFAQIAHDPKEIAFVFRSRSMAKFIDPATHARYRHLTLNDGALSWRQAWDGLGLLLADTAMLFRELSALSPWLYFPVVRQVAKRLEFRAFFNRHRFLYFMARDEYNTDHITRSQELRRAGARSFGILHGMSTGPTICPHIRYLDYDVLYVFGKHQHNAYADTWPKQMIVKTTGAYRLTREQLARERRPHGRDIIVFGNQISDPPGYIRIAAAIVRSFPDRTIYLKLKYPRERLGADHHDAYLDQFAPLPENVRIVYGPPYELFQKSGYSFSALSTVVGEALQMGLISFFIDAYQPEQDILFRDFPDLCVISAEAAVERILATESGRWTYPRERFADLIDLSDRNIFDEIRGDLGLPPFVQDAGSQAAWVAAHG